MNNTAVYLGQKWFELNAHFTRDIFHPKWEGGHEVLNIIGTLACLSHADHHDMCLILPL